MTKISIPKNSRKRALIVVDMQKGFLEEVDQSVIANIQSVLQKAPYDLYVEAIFHADKGSLWDEQTDWTFKLEPTIPELKGVLQEKDAVLVTKTTKSAFGGDKDLIASFREKGIEEVHIVGVDTNDCVMATAYDSFDAGFFTYVIEECAGSSAGKEMHECALKILRNTDLTNHSDLIRDRQFI